ncbi:50S ribosomal protein L22 [Candidatus Uhrbacteria bacterium]|nr:50S ribosomal protein L22 [Candidatus Uhrbacteria bacterium]
MEVKAYARFIHMAPRKVRLVTNLVKGMPVEAALRDLRFVQKFAALPVRKVIESAVANATHNAKLDRKTLSIQTITADAGPTIKRWRPRAFGRAAPIRKRMTHITVVLTDQPIKKKGNR